MVYCMFEQSGTFKNEFKKLGYEAIDLDIRNDFGQTDKVVDLFSEIEIAMGGGETLFDGITASDMIFAFFPCTYFSSFNVVNCCGKNKGQSNWSLIQKLEYSKDRVQEIARHHKLICELFLICLKKGLRMVVENPYSQPHFLSHYFPIEPSIIDSDRTRLGDDYKKPTQYFFVNMKPKNNLELFCGRGKAIRRIADEGTVDRSMISPVYARNFIKTYLEE